MTLFTLEERKIVIISPYTGIINQLDERIRHCEIMANVDAVSTLHGYDREYDSLQGVDFDGKRWDNKKEPGFTKYLERQICERSDALAEEIMAGKNSSLVIDFECLAGPLADILEVYNIGNGFAKWCLRNRVPRLFLSPEMKKELDGRMKIDFCQGCYTWTPLLNENEDNNELERAEQDLRIVLSGRSEGISFFQYQPAE